MGKWEIGLVAPDLRSMDAFDRAWRAHPDAIGGLIRSSLNRRVRASTSPRTGAPPPAAGCAGIQHFETGLSCWIVEMRQ